MHTLSTKHVGYNKSSFEFGFVVLLLKAKRLTRLLQFHQQFNVNSAVFNTLSLNLETWKLKCHFNLNVAENAYLEDKAILFVNHR